MVVNAVYKDEAASDALPRNPNLSGIPLDSINSQCLRVVMNLLSSVVYSDFGLRGLCIVVSELPVLCGESLASLM